MIHTYNQRFYPNPFRYRKLKTIKNNYQVIKQIITDLEQKIKVYLNDNKLYEMDDYIDEFLEFKSELRLIRIIREKIKEKINNLYNKYTSKFYTKPLIKYIEGCVDNINNVDNYQKNLRYLELPVQPLVNRKGFEIQLLSSDFIEDAIEEIEDEFSYIYEHCTDFLPDSIEMWTDYALLNPDNFPIIAHDDLLEYYYEIFDKIFDDLQKNSTNLFNWVIAGDVNNRVLKIIKPGLTTAKGNYFFSVIKSLTALIILLVTIRYIIKSSTLLVRSNKKLVSDFEKTLTEFKKEVSFRKFRFEQRTKSILAKLNKLNLNNKFKYKLLRQLTDI